VAGFWINAGGVSRIGIAVWIPVAHVEEKGEVVAVFNVFHDM
jgi:hypothetical protein